MITSWLNMPGGSLRSFLTADGNLNSDSEWVTLAFWKSPEQAQKGVSTSQDPGRKEDSPLRGFPHSVVGKESTCNTGDPGLIPRLGRSPGEGIGYPLQYFWAALVAQLVKNPPQWGRPGLNPWVGKIFWRRERLPTLSILAWRIPWTCSPWGCNMTERPSLHFTSDGSCEENEWSNYLQKSRWG